MTCPLCLNKNIEFYLRDKVREYFQCLQCNLVFVNPNHFLTDSEEKDIYDLHQNNYEDLGYQEFLNKLLNPLSKGLQLSSKGLDFGSGPGPVVSKMMYERGFEMDNFDIYYANNEKLLNQKYDFITCTEVIEHLHHPHREISLLTNLLNDNGLLGIMTKRVINKDRFKTWHYKNDLTHVCFFSEKSFEYISEKWNFDLKIINSDSIILTKL